MLKELSAALSDSIGGHYVSQCVALASFSVVQSVCKGAKASSFTAKNAANKRHIRRNRAHQLVLGMSCGAGEEASRKYFVANFSYYLGIVGRFMPATLDGAGGKLQEIGCRVWSSNFYLHAQTAPGPKPMVEAACNDFNKRMYRHEPGVSTGFCGLHLIRFPQDTHIMPTLNFSDTLSLAGILISVLFGIWGIYLSLRRAKYPAGLTFVREQSVALLDDFATRIPNLAVLYKDTPIDKSVVLLSGYLVNDGNVDITPQMTERPLTCALPTDCTWLEFKLTGAAEALSAVGTIAAPQILELNFGLFRRDEAFSFQALALVNTEYAKKKPTALVEALRWSHRIAGLGSIKTTTLPEPETKSRKDQWIRKGALILMAAFYLFFGLSQATGLGPLGRVPAIAYEHAEGEKQAFISLTPNRDGTTTVKDVRTGEERKVVLSEFVKSASLRPVYQERQEPERMLVLSGIATFLMSGFVIFMAFGKDYKRYRLRRMVAVVARET